MPISSNSLSPNNLDGCSKVQGTLMEAIVTIQFPSHHGSFCSYAGGAGRPFQRYWRQSGVSIESPLEHESNSNSFPIISRSTAGRHSFEI